MGRMTEILNAGQCRAKEMKLAYEGALMPDEYQYEFYDDDGTACGQAITGQVYLQQ